MSGLTSQTIACLSKLHLDLRPACYGAYLPFSVAPMLTGSASCRNLSHLWYLQAYAEIPLIVTSKKITLSLGVSQIKVMP